MSDISDHDLGDALASAIVGVSSMFANAAIVGALSERGVLTGHDVAKWLDFFAANPAPATPPAMQVQIAAQLQEYAKLLRSLAQVPDNAGRA